MFVGACVQFCQNDGGDDYISSMLEEAVSESGRPSHVGRADIGVQQVGHSSSPCGRRSTLRARCTSSMIASQYGSSASAPAVRRMPSPHFVGGSKVLTWTST